MQVFVVQIFTKIQWKLGGMLVICLRRIRAEHACKLLLESDMAIYEIAQELGYDDEKHFSRYFRKQIGTPPSIYRQRRD